MARTDTVAVLFTDLVGSTALSSRLGPDRADVLRQTHFDLLRGAIQACHGTEVKNVGDGLMVVLPSPSAGLACAVGMQQAIDAHNRGAPTPLAVRIGLSAGEVTTDDGDYFGEPVVEAARLCAECEGGRILATDLVRVLAGTRGGHTISPAGTRRLKGLTEPVSVVEVEWLPLPVTAPLPLPGRLAVERVLEFVGREAERGALDAAWKDACNGQRRAVLLAGEAGIGKTRLATEFALDAYAEAAVVLAGGCDEDLAAPYRPWLEALGHLVANAADDAIERLGSRSLSDLARVVPAARDRLPHALAGLTSDPETERYLFYSAVIDTLAAVAGDAPALVVLDDLHWADTPSLLLLRHVIGAAELRGVLVLATFRDSEVGADHPLANLLAALHREPGVERITLSGLNDAELVTFVDTAAGYELGDTGAAFAHALYRETDGNPFFAWEVMQHLAESGVVARSGSGEWTGETGVAELGLPASVREVIGRRVARLGEDAQHALRMAAVIGAHIELDVLSTALGIEADTVLDILEGAERSGLLRATGPERFGWTHALIQHSLYAELSPTRRARAHRQVAEAFETLGMADARVQDLARHWAAAVRPAEATKAIEYARRAGDDALATLAPDAAARSYAQALELLDQQPIRDDALRCDLLLCIAVARQQAGDATFRDFVLEAANLAQQLGDTDRLVQAALTDYVRGYVAVGDVDRVRLLEAALVAVGEGASVDRARLLAALSFELNFADPQYAVDITVEAIALARRIGDPKTLGYVLRVGTGHHFVPASASIWLADAREAIELAERAGEPADIFRSEYNLYGAAIIGGDPTTALEALRHMTALADEIPRPDFRWMARFLGADQALLAGDAETAERLVNEAYAVGSATAQPGALTIYAAGLNNVRWFQGRQAEAQLVMEEAAAADEDLSLLHLDTSAQSPDEGSPPRPTLAEAVERLPRDGAWLPAISIYADVAGRDHDIIAAETIYEQMAPFSSLVVAATGIYRGAVTHYLGVLATVLGRYDDAGAHFADALAVHERLRAPFHLARTELGWARMLLERDAAGDHERALDLLQHARDRAYEHGCAQLERRARRLLEQTG